MKNIVLLNGVGLGLVCGALVTAIGVINLVAGVGAALGMLFIAAANLLALLEQGKQLARESAELETLLRSAEVKPLDN